MTPKLPIPELKDTLARYQEWVKPLLDEQTFEQTQQQIADFVEREGRLLQTDLQQFASTLSHGNWLIEAWLEAYLSERRALPLASNVGFELNRKGASLAQWVYALSAVCADWRHGRITVPKSFSGEPVCMVQWKVLQGSMRTACAECDEYHFAEDSRTIGILKNGFYFRLPVLDEEGEAYHPDYFKAALQRLESFQTANPYPVAVPSFLGSKQMAAVCNRLAENPDNARLLDDIGQDLFHVSLNDTGNSDAEQNLAAATFQAQQSVWCYKPITLWHNRSDGGLVLHCEHTWPDGGAIIGILQHAQGYLQHTEGKMPSEIDLQPQSWQLPGDLAELWPQWQQAYAKVASTYGCRIIEPAKIPYPRKGISTDALMQFVLQYAQLAVFGQVRNTYEAVDVSHFQSGRTECVRPVSEASVAFVAALHHNEASADLFQTALAEHKARIKACKTGHGINRHLLGLKLMAVKRGMRPEIFEGKAYQTITEDFFSTSTIGGNQTVCRFAFAPTSRSGFGVNYTITDHGWEFVLCYEQEQESKAELLAAAIEDGCRRLADWMEGHIQAV
ncbi:choline/carnitine O-acyltransferase [Neisseria arctica]|nr:choline/carnitine O-acyltransferase [Neisseria arctica]UOO86904.1 choline/carnitine O-acyltransferase [Neisseria arctica]